MRPTAPSCWDSVQGLATLKAFGQSAARGRFLAEKAHDLFRSTMWELASNSASRGITDAGIAVGAAAALGIGAARVAEGAIGIEVLLIVLMMGVEVFRPMRDLRALLHTGMLGRAAAASLFRLFDTRPVIEDVEGAADPAALAPTLAFKDVHFAYPGGRRPAHDGLSFEVGAGERVGIVGASGAGKSTILRLLMRFDGPAGGACPARRPRTCARWDRAALRARFGVVNQDTYLFHGTAAENIRFGKPDASDAEIEAAARAANAHGFIARLPQGYDTVIGERGIRLSGGQRQRIAIARALLRDAPNLLLDEALSSVDAENEGGDPGTRSGGSWAGRTVLIMAHRLSSVIGRPHPRAGRRPVGGERSPCGPDGEARRLPSPDGGPGARGGWMRRRPRRPARSPLSSRPPRTATLTLPLASSPPTRCFGPKASAGGAPGCGCSAWCGPSAGRVNLAFGFGVARVVAFIGVGVLSALVVAGLKQGTPVGGLLIALYAVAPLAGVLHWLESWVAHDMAFRLLTEMRIAALRQAGQARARLPAAPAHRRHRRHGDAGRGAGGVLLRPTRCAGAGRDPGAGGGGGTLLVYGWPTAAALAPSSCWLGSAPSSCASGSTGWAGGARDAWACSTPTRWHDPGADRATRLRPAEGAAQGVPGYRAGPPPGAHPLLPRLTIQMALIETATGLAGLPWCWPARPGLPPAGWRRRCCRCSRSSRWRPFCRSPRNRPHRPAAGGHAGCHAAAARRAPCTGRGGGRPRRVPRTGRAGTGNGGRQLHLRGHEAAGAQRRDAHGPPRRDAGAGGPLPARANHHRPPLHALLGSGGRHGAAGWRGRARLDARCAPRPASRWWRRTLTCSTTRSAPTSSSPARMLPTPSLPRRCAARRLRTSSPRCRRGWKPAAASGARSSQAGSVSGSRSPARS